MRHFKEDDWIDFARGLAPPALHKQLTEHLASGCAGCVGGAWLWFKVAFAASRQAEFEPAPEAVAAARRLIRSKITAHGSQQPPRGRRLA